MNIEIRSYPRMGVKSLGGQRALGAFVLSAALGLLLFAVPRAGAMTISQQTSYEVNGATVTGCADIKGASTAQNTQVDLYPCNGNANEQWTYLDDGRIVGLGGNCLTVKETIYVVMASCSGASSQVWTIHASSSGATIQRGSQCLDPSGLGATGDELGVGACTSSSYWVLQ